MSLHPASCALGALLSFDDFGSSVERDEGGHPLWQVLMPVVSLD
jgi:hypothetical protein